MFLIWIGKSDVKSVEQLITGIPSEKYEVGDSFEFEDKKLQRSHSFLRYSKECNEFDETITSFIYQLFDQNIHKIVELKNISYVDVGFEVQFNSDSNYPIKLGSSELEIVLNIANWISFDITNSNVE